MDHFKIGHMTEIVYLNDKFSHASQTTAILGTMILHHSLLAHQCMLFAKCKFYRKVLKILYSRYSHWGKMGVNFRMDLVTFSVSLIFIPFIIRPVQKV